MSDDLMEALRDGRRMNAISDLVPDGPVRVRPEPIVIPPKRSRLDAFLDSRPMRRVFSFLGGRARG